MLRDEGAPMAKLDPADEAMRLLRRAVVELIRGAVVDEAVTNGDRIAFVHALTDPRYFRDPACGEADLVVLAEAAISGGRAGMGWRYHRASDAFGEYIAATGSTLFEWGMQADGVEPMTQDGAEEGIAVELVA